MTDPAQLVQLLDHRSRQLEAACRMAQALYSHTGVQEILQNALDAACEVIGAEGGTIFLHNEKKKTLRFSCVNGPLKEELFGRSIPDDVGNVGQVFQSTKPIITDDTSIDETHFEDIDRETDFHTYNIAAVPLKSINGDPIGVLELINKRDERFDEYDLDVLTIVATVAATAIENARLHEAALIATQAHLLGDISHDIKNMLTPVVTGLDYLNATTEDLQQGIQALKCELSTLNNAEWQKIENTVTPMIETVPEIAEMGMESAGRIQHRVREFANAVKGIATQPVFEQTDIVKVATGTVRALEPVCHSREINLKLDTACEELVACIDPERVYNALYNLVDNAASETPEGGTITIAIAKAHNPEIGGDVVSLSVSDTGKGISEDVRHRLFTDHMVSTKPGGTGLGTRIVKNVVDAHGGRIWVESEPGHGATFTMHLPLESKTNTTIP
jgi:signal transduction histidine kinase